MNKKELKEALDAAGISYNEDATNDELEALLEKGEKKEEPKVEKLHDDDQTSKYGKLSKFLQAYLKQNPEKFAIKWERGELKGL